jgi:hypothetical protein
VRGARRAAARAQCVCALRAAHRRGVNSLRAVGLASKAWRAWLRPTSLTQTPPNIHSPPIIPEILFGVIYTYLNTYQPRPRGGLEE